MPIATYDQYCEMLDRAKAGKFAYPAINVTGLESLNACLSGFSAANSDGIIQVSTGGGKHANPPFFYPLNFEPCVPLSKMSRIHEFGDFGTKVKHNMPETHCIRAAGRASQSF